MHNFILFLHKEEGGQGNRRTVETSALINMIVFIQATKVGSFFNTLAAEAKCVWYIASDECVYSHGRRHNLCIELVCVTK
jgi:hypothetical protein